jgi:hypothetical protein
MEGKPGNGKSTLTKYFKENLLKQDSDAESSIAASFFYSYREGELQTSHYNMLRSILYDILDQNEAFFYHFQREHRDYEALLRQSSHDNIVKLHYASLKKILLSLALHPQAERLYLIIDAVDESDDEHRQSVLQLLFDLCLKLEHCIIKVFVASRPMVSIGNFHNVIKIHEQTKGDISRLARSFLRDLNFGNHLVRAQKHIEDKAEGVFVWVQLVKEELQRFRRDETEDKLFEFLTELPTELDGFYIRILGKLRGRKRDPRLLENAKTMFQFALFARRPLTVDELRHALGIKANSDAEFMVSDEHFRSQLINEIEQHVIDCGGNLFEIRPYHGTVASSESSPED